MLSWWSLCRHGHHSSSFPGKNPCGGEGGRRAGLHKTRLLWSFQDFLHTLPPPSPPPNPSTQAIRDRVCCNLSLLHSFDHHPLRRHLSQKLQKAKLWERVPASRSLTTAVTEAQECRQEAQVFRESLGREVALEQCLSPRARFPEVGEKDHGGAASGVNRVLLSNSVCCRWKVPSSLRSSEDKDPGCMKEKWRPVGSQ